jgi:phage repressor protein C with HTH and peptisase S24 domain
MIELEILKKTLENGDKSLHSANTFSERLGRIALIVGGKSALSRATGLSVSGIGKYLDGGDPSISKFEQICTRLELNPLFMLKGELPAQLGGGDKQSNDEFAYIPSYDITIAAGHGTEPIEGEPTRQLAFRQRWLNYRGLHQKNLIIVYAKGDSMEPTIEDSNSLLIDTSQTLPSDGGIYVLRNEGQLIVKRTQHLLGQGILLISDNKAYKEQIIPANGSSDVQVLGKVVWIGKDIQ